MTVYAFVECISLHYLFIYLIMFRGVTGPIVQVITPGSQNS